MADSDGRSTPRTGTVSDDPTGTRVRQGGRPPLRRNPLAMASLAIGSVVLVLSVVLAGIYTVRFADDERGAQSNDSESGADIEITIRSNGEDTSGGSAGDTDTADEDTETLDDPNASSGDDESGGDSGSGSGAGSEAGSAGSDGSASDPSSGAGSDQTASGDADSEGTGANDQNSSADGPSTDAPSGAGSSSQPTASATNSPGTGTGSPRGGSTNGDARAGGQGQSGGSGTGAPDGAESPGTSSDDRAAGSGSAPSSPGDAPAAGARAPAPNAGAATLGTYNNPAPLGTTIEISLAGAATYEVTLGASTLNADVPVAAASTANPPPPAGMHYALVPVTVKYRGAEVGVPWVDIKVEYVSPTGSVHAPGGTNAIAPSPTLSEMPSLRPQESAVGNVLVTIPGADTPSWFDTRNPGGVWAVSAPSSSVTFYFAAH